MPDLTIAILTYNRSNTLKEALVAIRKGSVGIADHIEVVVSDNASEDDTEKMVLSFDGLDIRYFRNATNVGGAENVLRVCERSTGNYVMLHSDDDLLCPGALQRLIEIIQDAPQLGVISSPLEAFENSPNRTLAKLRFPGDIADLYLSHGSEAFSSLFLRACSLSGLVIRRDLLDIYGARKSIRSNYPQIYLTGQAVKQADALYLAKPLMKIRLEDVKRWDYSRDFMSGAILEILKDLTKNETWKTEARRKIIKKRILASYGPLQLARCHSWGSFIRVARRFASVPEYCQNYLFWCLVIGIGVLGKRRLGRFRHIWRGPVGDTIK